jgi:hypothetical protein
MTIELTVQTKVDFYDIIVALHRHSNASILAFISNLITFRDGRDFTSQLFELVAAKCIADAGNDPEARQALYYKFHDRMNQL